MCWGSHSQGAAWPRALLTYKTVHVADGDLPSADKAGCTDNTAGIFQRGHGLCPDWEANFEARLRPCNFTSPPPHPPHCSLHCPVHCPATTCPPPFMKCTAPARCTWWLSEGLHGGGLARKLPHSPVIGEEAAALTCGPLVRAGPREERHPAEHGQRQGVARDSNSGHQLLLPHAN